MKAIIRAILKLSSMSVAQKITVGLFIGQMFPDHAGDYPKTAPNTPDQRANSTTRLSTAHAASLDGGRTAHNELVAAEAEFDALFGAYRDWANQPDVALGSTTRINNLGLNASTSEAKKAQPPVTPTMKEITKISAGKCTVACEKVDFATNYNYFVAYGLTEPADDDFRHLCSSPRSKETLTVTPWPHPVVPHELLRHGRHERPQRQSHHPEDVGRSRQAVAIPNSALFIKVPLGVLRCWPVAAGVVFACYQHLLRT